MQAEEHANYVVPPDQKLVREDCSYEPADGDHRLARPTATTAAAYQQIWSGQLASLAWAKSA
jgi:hypothetical protein